MTTANPPDEPGVRVTLATIYNLLLNVQETVGKLAERHDHTADDVRDHEARLRDLESARWPLKQVATVTTVGTFVLGAFGLLITVVWRVL